MNLTPDIQGCFPFRSVAFAESTALSSACRWYRQFFAGQ